jgi:hypothetical protein
MTKLQKNKIDVSGQLKKCKHLHNFLKLIGNILKYFSVRRHCLKVKGNATAIVPASHLITKCF